MSLVIENRILEDVALSLAAYLPGGELWESAIIPGTNLNAVVLGMSGMLLDAETFLSVYSSEFIPLNTDIFIEDWEQALQIPDDCFPGPEEPIRANRRLHILVKLAALGVQTSDDFVNLAVIMGFVGTTVESGIDAGIPEPEGQFTIVVGFAFDENNFPLTFPIPFGSEQFTILECLFTKLKPDNCAIQFGLI